MFKSQRDDLGPRTPFKMIGHEGNSMPTTRILLCGGTVEGRCKEYTLLIAYLATSKYIWTCFSAPLRVFTYCRPLNL